jgi:hypothetical protein
MRVIRTAQMELGEIDVSQIKFYLRSRDDIPKILWGITAPVHERGIAPECFCITRK